MYQKLDAIINFYPSYNWAAFYICVPWRVLIIFFLIEPWLSDSCVVTTWPQYQSHIISEMVAHASQSISYSGWNTVSWIRWEIPQTYLLACSKSDFFLSSKFWWQSFIVSFFGFLGCVVSVVTALVCVGRRESWRVGIGSYWTRPSSKLDIVTSTLLVSTEGDREEGRERGRGWEVSREKSIHIVMNSW